MDLVGALIAALLFIQSGALFAAIGLFGTGVTYLLFASYTFVTATVIIKSKQILLSITNSPLILAFIALAFFSALWSVDPGTTINESMRLALGCLTAAAMLQWRSRSKILQYLTIALGVACTLSILAPSVGYNGRGDFRGLFQQKNILGFAATICAISSLHFVLRNSSWMKAFYLLTLAASIACVVMSKSASSQVATLAGLSYLAIDRLAQSYLRTPGKRALILVPLVGIVIFAASLSLPYILSMLGKDPTLTGRVQLWAVGRSLIEKRATLGYGYQVLADENSTFSSFLVKSFGDYALQFHNSWINIQFQLGYPGLIMNGIFFAAVFRAAIAGQKDEDLSLSPLLAALGIALVLQSLTESTFGSPRSIQTLLLSLILIPSLKRASTVTK
ncbi:MAG: O-antigen ligase family protein [Sneathiella sp.]|nr:O-antigen ligase family protein [Sneathiella sp.]